MKVGLTFFSVLCTGLLAGVFFAFITDLKAIRDAFEAQWNLLHEIRTLAAVVSFGLALWGSRSV